MRGSGEAPGMPSGSSPSAVGVGFMRRTRPLTPEAKADYTSDVTPPMMARPLRVCQWPVAAIRAPGPPETPVVSVGCSRAGVAGNGGRAGKPVGVIGPLTVRQLKELVTPLLEAGHPEGGRTALPQSA